MTVTTFDQEEPKDIVQQLKEAADEVFYNLAGGYGHIESVLREAAHEIETLRRVLGMTRN